MLYDSVVGCLRFLLHNMLSHIAYTFRLNIVVQFMISANNRIRFGLQIVFVCTYITLSRYHYCANLSDGIEFIKCLCDIFCGVWIKLSILSQLYIIQYVGLCVSNLPSSLVVAEIIYILCLIIIIKSGLLTITHCLGLCHETMVCAVFLKRDAGDLRCHWAHYDVTIMNYLWKTLAASRDVS